MQHRGMQVTAQITFSLRIGRRVVVARAPVLEQSLVNVSFNMTTHCKVA